MLIYPQTVSSWNPHCNLGECQSSLENMEWEVTTGASGNATRISGVTLTTIPSLNVGQRYREKHWSRPDPMMLPMNVLGFICSQHHILVLFAFFISLIVCFYFKVSFCKPGWEKEKQSLQKNYSTNHCHRLCLYLSLLGWALLEGKYFCQ